MKQNAKSLPLLLPQRVECACRPAADELSFIDCQCLQKATEMYQIVPVTVGDVGLSAMRQHTPPKKKRVDRKGRRLIAASLIGAMLVMAAVVSWCYYSASLSKADLLKTELLDLRKDGFVIHNSAGPVIFRMAFRYIYPQLR